MNVILAKYEQLSEMDALPVTEHHVEAFRQAWKVLDPAAKHWIAVEDVQQLLDQLPRQLGYDERSGEDDILLHELRLPSLPDGTTGEKPVRGCLQPHTQSNNTWSKPLFYELRWIPCAFIDGNRHRDGACIGTNT